MLRFAFGRRTSRRQPVSLPTSPAISSGALPAGAKPLLTVALALSSSLALVPEAEAQFFFFDDPAPKYRRRVEPQSAPRRIRREESEKSAKAGPDIEAAGPPLLAVISIDDQHLSVYGENGLIERADISSGTDGHPTPTGIFGVIQKERWHESNLYSGAPMPYMQRITWSGVAMHTGVLPGYPASHGCIRLRDEFAGRWYRMTKLGLRVVISPFEVLPEPIVHAALPVPTYWPRPMASAPSTEQTVVKAAALDGWASLAPQAVDRPMNPVEYATAEKAAAKAAIKASEHDETVTSKAHDAAKAALRTAEQALDGAEQAFRSAERRLAYFGLVGSNPPPRPRSNFTDNIVAAREAYEAANSRLSTAQATFAAAKAGLVDAQRAEREAEQRTVAAKDRLLDMGRRQETLTVLVSAKDKRIYVRQSLRPVLDAPIEIKEPDRQVGNHVFVAAPPAVGETALRWTSVTLPVEPDRIVRKRNPRPGESIAVAVPAVSATEALDRIVIPPDVMKFISERIWAGSSIIISDHAMGRDHEKPGNDVVIETTH